MPTVKLALPRQDDWVKRSAIGIGLPGVLIGLAIGSYGESGEIALTIVLALGLACQQALSGMDLAAAPAARSGLPARLALFAAVPVFLAAVLGMYLTEDLAGVALSGLAAGALLHIVTRCMANISRAAAPKMYLGVMSGLCAGFLCYVVAIALWGSVE